METVRSLLYKGHDPYKDYTPIEYDLQGWASTSPAFSDSIDEINPKLIIEVGTWKGASAVHMATLCKQKGIENFEIVCVDTFLASVEHWTMLDPNLTPSKMKHGRPIIYDQFLSNMIISQMTAHITPFPIDSVNGALTLKRLGVQADLIYIDAGHEYPSVYMDLMLYKDILRPGGHLLGDDWFHAPIKEAVKDALGEVITKSHDKFLWVKP